MSSLIRISSALISVYSKENLQPIVAKLHRMGVRLFSTGGTLSFIEGCGAKAEAVEALTGYPSILGGRVKTLHPKVFGGILARRENEDDLFQLHQHHIPEVDLVIVDLYPFADTVASGAPEEEIIEKIDIGGVALIRAAAKNFQHVAIISSRDQYGQLLAMLDKNEGCTNLAERRQLAREAFEHTSRYDTAIYNYFCGPDTPSAFAVSLPQGQPLRYGENPHQHGVFYGSLADSLEQLHGKEISYNNLLDIEAAIGLMAEFDEPTIAILKHNNPCGLASHQDLAQAWAQALAGDPISAFGGVIMANRPIDAPTAQEMDKLFFDILIAPGFDDRALGMLTARKNRIILKQNTFNPLPPKQFRSLLGGVLVQDRDTRTVDQQGMRPVTTRTPTQGEYRDLVFANKIVKHSKSNAIVLAKGCQLVASGVGQTSRVDALKHSIAKAQGFNFDLRGAVLASDAFFPFADSVEIAAQAGITAIVQPGGSIRDQDSIDLCNQAGLAMVFTGVRHFKH